MAGRKTQAIWFAWLIAILIPVFAVYPALTDSIEEYGYDSAEFHIYRAVLFSDARADGTIFPRWTQSLNNGLGGPFFSLYPALTYFLMDLLFRLGLAHPLAWRVLVALALMAGSAGMFGLGLALFRRADAALAAATISVYSSFLLRDLFERGAVAGMALALFPAMLWLGLRFAERPTGLRLLIAATGLALITLIHSQTAFLLIPLVGMLTLFLFLRDGARQAVLFLLPSIGGALLTMLYILPFTSEVKYVQFENASQIDYANPVTNPLRLDEILTLPHKFDRGLDNNAMGEAAGGLLYAGALGLGIVVSARLVRQKKIADAILVATISGWGIAMIWMQLDSATPLWSAVPALAVFLFRWRLLATLGILAAIASGYALVQLPERWVSRLAVSLIVIGIAMQLGLLYPSLLHRYTRFPPRPTTADALASARQHGSLGFSSFDEFLPVWRDAPFTDAEYENVRAAAIGNLPPDARILQSARRNEAVDLRLDSPVSFTAAFHVLYFPGWVGYVDGVAQLLEPEKFTGYVLMRVPAGTHTLALRYEGTPAQGVGNAISVATAIGLVALASVWRNARGTAIATVFPQPRWELAALLVIAAIAKFTWVDPQTNWFRNHSTCAAIDGARTHADVWFGERIRLCGFTLDRAELRAGDHVTLTLYWQLGQNTREPIYSFVHLLGKTFNPETGNPLWGQKEKPMFDGLDHAEWKAGKLYRDQYAFRVSPHTPPGDYQLEIGWFLHSDGTRASPRLARAQPMLATSDLDSLLVSGIRVRP